MINLSTAIEALRYELEQSIEKGKNKDIQFQLGEISIQLEVIAEKSAEAEGKINWWILSGGLKGKVSNMNKHLLTVYLNPVDKEGRPLKVHSKRDKEAG